MSKFEGRSINVVVFDEPAHPVGRKWRALIGKDKDTADGTLCGVGDTPEMALVSLGKRIEKMKEFLRGFI